MTQTRILRPRKFTWYRHLSKTMVSIPRPKPHCTWHSTWVGWCNKLQKHPNQTVLLEARRTCLILFLPGFLRFLSPDPFPMLNPHEEEAEPTCPWVCLHWKTRCSTQLWRQRCFPVRYSPKFPTRYANYSIFQPEHLSEGNKHSL